MKVCIYEELNEKYKDQILNLLAKSFPLNFYDAHSLFSFVVSNIPGQKWLTVKGENDNVVGVLCLLDRKISYFGVDLELVGLSYMATDVKHRNFIVSNLLKETMFSYIEQNSDLSMGFARRAMDNYWYPYGYLGVTNFGEFTVSPHALYDEHSPLASTSVGLDHVESLQAWHKDMYEGGFGPLNRSIPLWNYYLKKANREKIIIEILSAGDTPVGYIVRDENVIEELAYEIVFEKEIAEYVGSTLSGFDQVRFRIGYKHPFASRIRSFPHSFTTRYAWNGGHIVRITNLNSFIKKIRPVFEKRLNNAGVKDLKCVIGGFHFVYDSTSLKIEVPDQHSYSYGLTLHEWQKLIFGVVPSTDIVTPNERLSEEILNILFPTLQMQIPRIDEF